MKIVSELAEVCLSVWKFLSIATQKYINIYAVSRQKGRSRSHIAWQNVNLLGRFEFHWKQSVININEMISLLEQKIVGLQPKVTE